jgi:hypothetical protein
MYKTICLFIVLFLSTSLLALAEDSPQIITLKDGSQIKGVLAGIENGVYTVKTPIIGDVHVAANDVASITTGNTPAATLPSNNALPLKASGSSLDQQIAASQQQLMADPQNMQILQQMIEDPEIAKALQDPTLVQAVTSHDYQAVQSNPQVQKLMSNPNMQALIKKLAAQQQANSQ